MKISIIGGGNMGGAIALGIIKNHICAPKELTISHPSKSLCAWLTANNCPAATTQDNTLAAQADIVILAVKPWKIEEIIKEIKGVRNIASKSFISIAAGITTAELLDMTDIPADQPRPSVFRVIPNTAISLGESATFICSNNATPEQEQAVTNIFAAMGEVFAVEEPLMGAVTALSSCGIAYILKYIDASINGGVKLGIEQTEARKIVLQTVKGAVSLLEKFDTLPQEEINKVTTPGGLTFKGLTAMTENGFEKAIEAGLEASMSK
ncbi:MAG: pyrroline-5-carboxylate reductase [Tidjanibacter sp.]|nr:pyrroline-5-carboxylate reductase [Tidjanibacter sp.]